MRHLWWGLIPFVAALVALHVWWPGPGDVAVLVTLVCGLAYVVILRQRIPPLPAEQGPDKRDVQRDLPHRRADPLPYAKGMVWERPIAGTGVTCRAL
jgi:hypothetical protein